MRRNLQTILVFGLAAMLAGCAATPRAPASRPAPLPPAVDERQIVPLTLEQDRDIGSVSAGS